MTVKVSSIGLRGLEGYLVQVQVRIAPGNESMVIVGLPDASVKESRERVLAGLTHFDVDVTDKKVVVNLSPAEQKKNGPLFDLGIAIAALKELDWIKGDIPADTTFLGALALDGTIEKADGLLPAVISAKALGVKRVYLPYDKSVPAKMFADFECCFVHHLEDVVHHLEGQEILSFSPPVIESKSDSPFSNKPQKDFLHIIGHEQANKALVHKGVSPP